MLELNRLYNMDCMEAMRDMPDKYFELAIVDPPYGIGMDGQKECFCKNPKHNRKKHEKKAWDINIPNAEYLLSLNVFLKIRSYGEVTILLSIYQNQKKAGLFGIKDNMGY